MEKVVIVSGYFNPIHRGHIEYFEEAKKYAGKNGKVIVIINSDKQSLLKKKFSFIPEEDRLSIVSSLKTVDKAFISIDNDRTVCNSILKIFEEYSYNNIEFYFANGGDVTVDAPCPEEKICKEKSIKLLYGFGLKIQSSSWILEKSTSAYNKINGPTNNNQIITKKRRLV